MCILATACGSQKQDLQEHRLREFVDVRSIESVEAHNYSGHHWLTAAELQDFKSRLGSMQYAPGGSGQVKSVDMGTTVFVLHTHGHAYQLIGRPTSQYLGVPNKLVTQTRDGLAAEDQQADALLLFKFARPTNLNNYRKGPSIPDLP
ncbi:hypothetical protein [Hymenobacter perfusus]|uniref:Uncharacterized protein n=1 Tax=Hymenobacter perfusus TaxID=1236770 RepID=A0A3R9P3L6_9BACT|nr:hypothetical protein [Hymenobacter perfusus]RSK43534.1 hypothetical protein EI293_11630 [Hymenobacter perfusus]